MVAINDGEEYVGKSGGCWERGWQHWSGAPDIAAIDDGKSCPDEMMVGGIWQLCQADIYLRLCPTPGTGKTAVGAAVLEVTVCQPSEYAAMRGVS
jgi:hypothetical protein